MKKILVAADGAEALEILKEFAPDAIFIEEAI